MSHCIRDLEADRLFLSNKEPRHSNFQEMDLKVEFSILSTAGTPTSASRCCFWLASQASNWIFCWTLSVGHTRVGAGGQAAALPAQPSPGSTLQWSQAQGLGAKIQPMHHRVPSPQGAAYPSSQGSNRPSQPCTTPPYRPVHAGFTHGHSGLAIPSPTSSVLLNKPRRGLGSPGKMKW